MSGNRRIGPGEYEYSVMSGDDQAARLQAGYDAARRSYGDSYADYLISHDQELRAKGRIPRPWPISLQGNDGD